MCACRVGNTRYEIIGSPSRVSRENRRHDNDADRGGANERNPRTVLSNTSFVRLALPHVGSMRRLRQPDAIVRGRRAQGSSEYLFPRTEADIRFAWIFRSYGIGRICSALFRAVS